MASTSNVKWERDEGYSCCETARFGDVAVVICPPEGESGRWGYQAFDESDERAMAYGETIAEDYGFGSKADVKLYVEDCMSC